MAGTTFDSNLVLTDFEVIDGVASWESASLSLNNVVVSDFNNDGDLDIGTDTATSGSFTYTFTGFAVSENLNAFGIFSTTHNGSLIAIIPYNEADAPDFANAFPLVFDNGSGFWVPVPYTTDFQIDNAKLLSNCFLTGTRIATDRGEQPIETLQIGDRVRTADGRLAPVLWVAKQTLPALPWLEDRHAPVRITAHALGPGLPHTDLIVSADHGMVLDGLLINAGALVNHDTIRFEPFADLPPFFTYWHVETEAHEVILANGAPSESFIDYTGRDAFDNFDAYLDRYGAERIIPEMPLPRVACARLLPPALKARLGIEPPAVTLRRAG